ncbi:MAG: hypothetical protein HFI38_13200 [Lachnospiraceae bacterium]|jgi:hypothetical protein|nr:hypothetical protein [Lachnospiraceae bacterium]
MNFIQNDRDLIKKRIIRQKSSVRQKILAAVFLVSVLFIIYSLFLPQMNIGIGNVFLFFVSAFLISYGILDILNKGVKINNVFLVCYFFFLAINNLNISRLQIEKGIVESYYLLAGPILFWIIVRFFDNQKMNVYITGKLKFKPDTIGTALICVILFIKTLIIMQTGIRLLDANWIGGGTGDQYTVGGLSGIYQICIWTLLILLPRLNKKNKIITVAISVFFEVILAISRNNAMMIFTYLVLLFAISKRDKLLINKKVIRHIFVVIVLMLIAFTVFGNYRQRMRGWKNPGNTIEYLLQSNTSNGALNWIYGYTAINYDVMLQTMTSADHPMSLYSIFSPYIRVLFGYSALSEYQDAVYHIKALNGFNASTMFGPMVYEMGELYIIQAVLLAMQVGFFGLIARKEKADGHYAYLMAFGALAVFGNFYSIATYSYVSIVAMIIYLFLPLQREEMQI